MIKSAEDISVKNFLTLPGEEINVLVATHVMGWTEVQNEIPHNCIMGWWGFKPDGVSTFYSSFYATRGWKEIDLIPPYFTNLICAWEVVNKIKELTRYNGEISATRDPWVKFCSFLSSPEDGFNLSFWNINPESICIAALKTFGVIGDKVIMGKEEPS